METKKAIIRRDTTNTFLVLHGESENYEIILTEDNPNNVKGVFNKLLKELKKGLFQFELEDESTDLYNNICKEYLAQLNVELNTVFDELEDYNLIEA